MSSFLKNFNICMTHYENYQKKPTCIRVFSERITVQQLSTGKFSARETEWLTGVALGIGIVPVRKLLVKYSQLRLTRCSVFGNIYIKSALFCQPVSLQILNSMPAIASNYPFVSTFE